VRIGLRIFLGYFLIVGLAGFFVMRVFVDQVKPGVRQAMEETLVDTASALAALATEDMRTGRIADGSLARGLSRLRAERIDARIWGVRKRSFDYRVYVTDARGIVVYDSSGEALGRDYSRWNDVYLTLRGQYGARSSRTDPADDGSSVMHVAAPIRDDAGRIVGSLTVAKPNRSMEPFIVASQREILRQGWLLLGLSFVVGVVVTWWLSRSLGKLGRYARAVTAGERVAAPDLGRNEIGELGRALATMRERLDGKQYVENYVQTLAHEMKSPLAAIQGAAEILEQDPPEEDRRRFLANLGSQSQRLASMVDRMLELARVESRQGLAEAVPLDLVAIVREAVLDAEPRLRGRQLQVDFAPGPERAPVLGDRFLLAQAVGNLLDNAIAFSPDAGTIRIVLERDGEAWRLAVADEGPGIPEFALSRVFERFYSLPRPDGGRSSGIGLNFVREVLALHGGEVAVANGEIGAIASLRIPAA
jgi:two-component system sensor histidine kinase CreC